MEYSIQMLILYSVTLAEAWTAQKSAEFATEEVPLTQLPRRPELSSLGEYRSPSLAEDNTHQTRVIDEANTTPDDLSKTSLRLSTMTPDDGMLTTSQSSLRNTRNDSRTVNIEGTNARSAGERRGEEPARLVGFLGTETGSLDEGLLRRQEVSDGSGWSLVLQERGAEARGRAQRQAGAGAYRRAPPLTVVTRHQGHGATNSRLVRGFLMKIMKNKIAITLAIMTIMKIILIYYGE